ncbi:MAG: hypothetical protein ACU843_07450 [Gammaproteobacteria bacterium]
MPTVSLKAEDRPISFIFHDTSTDEGPVEVRLVIRPEDLTRTDPSRLSVQQTLGGAWADNFGRGLPSITISGHTGWGQGDRPVGLYEFNKLYSTVFFRWHEARRQAVENGTDPDKIKLIFADVLDEFVWVVAPQSFVLKRSRTRPLLSQYNISMTWVSDDVQETLAALAEKDAEAQEKKAMSSLDLTLASLLEFAEELKAGIGSVLGVVENVVAEFTELTANVLGFVQGVIQAGEAIADAVLDPLITIGQNLSRAGANLLRAYQSIYTFPNRILARFSRAAAAFDNAQCIFANIFRRRRFLPDYNSLYGASMCSSTVGGRPISPYATEDPFPLLFPIEKDGISMSSLANSAILRLASNDPVLGNVQASSLLSDMRAVNDGVVIL